MQWSLFLLILMGQCSFFTCSMLYEYHFIDEKKTWDEARSYCREHYTDLATVYDKADMNRLIDLAKNEKEAGIENDSKWTWHWSLPGVEYNETRQNWPGGEPNNFSAPENFNDGKNEKCAVLNGTGEWGADKCDEKKTFFCYDDKVILINESKTWDQALNFCREHHHDLVSITNLHQQRWVQERAKKANTDHIWLGLCYTCSLDLWFWVSDELVCYDHWGSERGPDNCSQSAAMMKGEPHNWHQKLNTEKFNFICALQ